MMKSTIKTCYCLVMVLIFGVLDINKVHGSPSDALEFNKIHSDSEKLYLQIKNDPVGFYFELWNRYESCGHDFPFPELAPLVEELKSLSAELKIGITENEFSEIEASEYPYKSTLHLIVKYLSLLRDKHHRFAQYNEFECKFDDAFFEFENSNQIMPCFFIPVARELDRQDFLTVSSAPLFFMGVIKKDRSWYADGGHMNPLSFFAHDYNHGLAQYDAFLKMSARVYTLDQGQGDMEFVENFKRFLYALNIEVKGILELIHNLKAFDLNLSQAVEVFVFYYIHEPNSRSTSPCLLTSLIKRIYDDCIADNILLATLNQGHHGKIDLLVISYLGGDLNELEPKTWFSTAVGRVLIGYFKSRIQRNPDAYLNRMLIPKDILNGKNRA